MFNAKTSHRGEGVYRDHLGVTERLGLNIENSLLSEETPLWKLESRTFQQVEIKNNIINTENTH